MDERKHDPEQQEQFIQVLKKENKEIKSAFDNLKIANKSIVKENRKLRKLLRLAEDELNRTKTESNERKQCLDSLTAELSKAKRKLRRMENSK